MTAITYHYRHVARMEWIKLRGLRSTAGILGLAVAAVVAIGVVTGANTENPYGDVTNNILVGIALAQVLLGVQGVLTMTSEYTSGTIRATLAAVPRRPLVLLGKAGVFGASALVVGELATFGGFLAGCAALRPTVPRPSLGDPDVLRAVFCSGVYLALIALIGLGLGAILRHSAPAIATLVGIVFVLPALGVGRTGAAKFLPELIAANSLTTTKPVKTFTWPPWVELAIVAVYAVVLLGAGSWLLVRRDA
jgi:hypothetical protein